MASKFKARHVHGRRHYNSTIDMTFAPLQPSSFIFICHGTFKDQYWVASVASILIDDKGEYV